MKNLKNYGVHEMNAKQARNVNGGGDLIRVFWKAMGAAAVSFGRALDRERKYGGTSLNYKY